MQYSTSCPNFWRTGADLRRVGDLGEAQVHAAFVHLDVGALGRRQLRQVRRHVVRPGVVGLDGGHAHG